MADVSVRKGREGMAPYRRLATAPLLKSSHLGSYDGACQMHTHSPPFLTAESIIVKLSGVFQLGPLADTETGMAIDQILFSK